MADRTCKVDDCDTAAWARSLCNRHYKRWRRYGDPTAKWAPKPPDAITEKTCSRCERLLPAENYWRRIRTGDGLQSACKECMGHADRLRLYGLSSCDYDELLAKQGGACAICKSTPDRPLVVDHCHATGAIRGLLCGRCNSAIGLLDDDPKRAASAVAYLTT